MNLDFNSEQQAGVNAVEGVHVMLAGPGSGKTRVLVGRYLNMIGPLSIPQRNILNLTFTNAAATEMVERVGLMDADKVFRTFHSFSLDLLKKERANLPFPTTPTIIPVRGEQFVLIKELLQVYRAITSYHNLAERITRWKAENVSPQQALDEEYSSGIGYFYALAYRDYEEKSRKQGWLDFDSLVKETVALLEKNDEVRQRWQRDYIAVDEAQDTDTTQFQLLKLLFKKNIFVVGDENQLIYEWRSAQSGNLTDFKRVFPGAQTLYLGTNYRSTQKLVDYFKTILPVDNGLASHMFSAREAGDSPRFVRYHTEDEEANETLTEIVARNILDDSAILARTNRQLQHLQRRAMSRNIKTEILGKKNVWQENEVKHLLDLTKERLMDTRPASVVMTELMSQHNLVGRYAFTNSNPMDKNPVENLNDIIRMAGRRSKATGQPLTVTEFLDWVRKITYMRKSKTAPVLTLSTVHQAKGREWKHVFLIGVNQGTMPHKEGELNEERRIFFVACSRAADELTISFSNNRSQFLNGQEMEIEEYGEDTEAAENDSL